MYTCICGYTHTCMNVIKIQEPVPERLRAKQDHSVRTFHRPPPLLKLFHVMYPLSNTSCRSQASRQRQIASRNSSLCYLATPGSYLTPSLAAGLWKSQVAEPASQPSQASQAHERIAFQLTTRKIPPLLLITALFQEFDENPSRIGII